MIKKLIVAAATVAVAISFAPTASFAKKKMPKEAKCAVVGSMCTKKLDSVGKNTGWANTKTCYPNHKLYLSTFPCYKAGGMCPAAKC